MDSQKGAEDFSAYDRIQEFLISSRNEDSVHKKGSGFFSGKVADINCEHDMTARR